MRCFRWLAIAPLAVGLAAFAAPVGAGSPSKDPILQPDKVVICSLNDVKGKTSPCGCHVPKGGLARQASFLDSVRTAYGQVYFADAGGYFPEDDVHQDAAWFLMDAYAMLGMDAVGVGERDLRYGLAYLRENARARKLPVVCANLLDRGTGKPVFATSTIVTRGRARVGFFGLISDRADLGPARDSLVASEPEAAARAMVAELRRKGATVVVALANTGKVASEDLCVAVDGIDVMIAAGGVPIIQRGRVIKNTLAVYGGEQGQNMARTRLTLAPDGKSVAAREADVIALSPEVPDQPEVLRLVTEFEGAQSAKRREAEQAIAREPVPAVTTGK